MTGNILKRLGLFYRTISFLKYSQILFQVKYRLKPKKKLLYYLKSVGRPVDLHWLSFGASIDKLQPGNDINTFCFLNLSVTFKDFINWNYQAYGKLWNYNLQYFNFLFYNNIPLTVKEDRLIDIGNWLKDGRLNLEPYPVSLRAMNTIRFLSFHKTKNKEINESLFAQLEFLNRNLEYHLLGNHLLENAFALFMGGYAFQKSEWQKKGKVILYQQLEEQILNDGGHFELSPMYHQIILFRLLELVDWYSKEQDADGEFLNFIEDKAGKMLAWLKLATFENGDIPHLNDSAKNNALTSAELFLIGETLKLKWERLYQFKKSGYRKYQFEDYECIIDVAELGPRYQPGHSHADALSFVLYKSQEPFIVDVGTSTYETGSRRDFERSTAAHNTVVIRDQNQSEVWGGFRVGRRASVEVIKESSTQLEAQHDGYYKTFGVYHKRKFDLSTHNVLEIIDDIGEIDGRILLHFHPGCKVLMQENNSLLVEGKAIIRFENGTQVCVTEYEFAEGFNHHRKASKAACDFRNHVTTTIEFL